MSQLTLYYKSNGVGGFYIMSYEFLHTMYKMPKSVVDNIHNENELINTIRNKFYAEYAKNFIAFSHLSLNIWSKLLPVSLSTLQRELKCTLEKHILDLSISESLVEVGEIYDIGLLAFDKDKDRLNEWLNTKNKYFNSKKPLEIMDNHKGRELVKNELIRIEYSEFA